MNEKLAARLADLPEQPGVYMFSNGEGKIVYVGKAKSLRSRVRSYFQRGASHPPKTVRMLQEVEDLELILTDSEVEALILENHLIKSKRPRFNVVLRDDKNYPYLKMTVGDEYARVGLVRKAKLDGNLYFGPYLPASVAWKTLRMIPRFFRVAICHVKFDGKQRPCLYYHLGQCLAPCAGYTNPEEYGRAAADARLFLEGRTAELSAGLESKMKEAAGREEFELAAHYRDLLENVRRLSEKQGISTVGLSNQDFFADHREGDRVALQVFQMREGRVQSRREFFFESIGEPPETFYSAVLSQYYGSGSSVPREVFLPVEPAGADVLAEWLSGQAGSKVRLTVPRRGARRRLLGLVERNAKLAFEYRFLQDHSHGVAVLEELRDILGLDEPPYRIECFDISNIQGTDSVASMVVWEGGKPRKSDYRRFRIRTVEGADDFGSIAEVVGRRYSRLLKEGSRLPDLVLIDGGKGQLSSAVAALDEAGAGDLAVASIAKREEEIFVQGRGEPIHLPRESSVLHLVQRIRDEAHRFAITYHRKLRSRRTLTTELLDVPGIGRATARKLLKRFGSVSGVKDADPAELRSLLGERVAGALAAHLGTPAGPGGETP